MECEIAIAVVTDDHSVGANAIHFSTVDRFGARYVNVRYGTLSVPEE